MNNYNIRLTGLADAHLSSRMALDGLLDFAVRSSPQGLQQLVSMLEVVFVMMFLYTRAAAFYLTGALRGLRHRHH